MTRCDVAVIGGGLIGCATAYYLARDGADVRLIEKNQINQHASSQNAGSLHFQLEHRLIGHETEFVEHFARVVPLNAHAATLWAGLEADLGADLEVSLEGGLMVAETPEQERLLRRKHGLEEKWGFATTLIDGREAHRLAPFLTAGVRTASYCACEGHANPRLVTPAFLRAAVRHGVRIETNTRVTALTRHHGGWRLALERGTSAPVRVDADIVVNAAGTWSGDVAALAGIHLPVFPVGLLMNVTEATTPFMSVLIQHAGRRLAVKQVRDGNLLIGGGWPSTLRRRGTGFDKSARPSLDPRELAGNLRAAVDTIPQLAALNLIRSWTGIVGVTADQLPILGEVREAPGLYVATGGSGFTLGPSYATILAALIRTGTAPLDVSLYAPDRFDHINMFMGGR